MSDENRKKAKNRRAAEKYPALRRELNLKTRYDLIDYDYLDKLSPEELDWLNRFTSEWANADFRHKKKLHRSKKKQREMYNANNARNRCIMTRAKASGMLSSIDLKKKGRSED